MLCKKPFQGFGCGQCLPCRLNSRRKKSARVVLESYTEEKCSFFTGTYNDEYLPKTADGKFTLRPSHLRNFWKRLRNEFPPDTISYYAVGEYGHEGNRKWNPHYHAALFGVACDGVISRPNDVQCYCASCSLVRKVWKMGNITLDELNETTANYICGYVEKKMTCKEDIRLEGRHPEFSRSSHGMGLSAVPAIAEALKSKHGAGAFRYDDVPMEIYQGKKALPLDRYMREKLRKYLSMEKINPETGEVTYGVPAHTMELVRMDQNPELYALQKSAYLAAGNAKEIHEKIQKLKDEKVSVVSQKILQLETKNTIFNSKRAKKL